MPRRIVLHAGFHKTGTTSVQQFLRVNRRALKPWLAIRLKPQIKPLLHATRGYSTWRDPVTLDKALNRFSKLLDSLPGMPKRTLCISAEELCGHLPGRDDLMDYSVAPSLLYGFVDRARAAFPNAEVALYFSTRAPGPWLHSAYWEHVTSSSMTLSFDDFVAQYRGAADLDHMVDLIAATVPCPTYRFKLEDSRTLPLGPVDPLLDLCDVPRDQRAAFVTPPPVNTRTDPAVLLALLDANRAYPDREARKAAKDAILAKARQP
ncbi:hypothetical protein [Sulfitobacter sabulilitoris]|uniref:Sulfotransferase family protein n=1 Tax=Sulfitobacter sabulilitoris TaxID=2562655 RepID=A0A5S3Q7V3_9RHOB|nr:hypothetical protein [Sulfitobacter sabulilitoris]TMM52943.1 hypothetical protein FDT80_11900 [Sulfitobacter sabulilitoris]